MAAVRRKAQRLRVSQRCPHNVDGDDVGRSDAEEMMAGSAAAVSLGQHVVEDLADVHAGIGDRVAPDQLVCFVDVGVVLVAVVAPAVLLRPAGILIFTAASCSAGRPNRLASCLP